MHLERQPFYNQSKMAAYPSVRERIATPFYLVQLQGPPPYFLTLGIDSSIRQIRRSESINVYHTHHVNKKGVS